MGTINNLYNKVQSCRLKEEMPNLILSTSYEITTLNQEQLYAGQLSTGEQIQPEYASKYYAKKKNALNPEPGFGVPDIFLTGALYKSMGVSVNDSKFDIEATVPYAAKLEEEYGSNLFRLSQTNKSKYSKGELLRVVKEYIENKTGLQFG